MEEKTKMLRCIAHSHRLSPASSLYLLSLPISSDSTRFTYMALFLIHQGNNDGEGKGGIGREGGRERKSPSRRQNQPSESDIRSLGMGSRIERAATDRDRAMQLRTFCLPRNRPTNERTNERTIIWVFLPKRSKLDARPLPRFPLATRVAALAPPDHL